MSNYSKSQKLKKLYQTFGAEKSADEDFYFKAMMQMIGVLSEEIDELKEKIVDLEEQITLQKNEFNEIQAIILSEIDVGIGGMEITHSHDHSDEDDDENGEFELAERDEMDEESFVSVQCPHCEELLYAADDEMNGEIECPFCNKMFLVKDNLILN